MYKSSPESHLAYASAMYKSPPESRLTHPSAMYKSSAESHLTYPSAMYKSPVVNAPPRLMYEHTPLNTNSAAGPRAIAAVVDRPMESSAPP